MIQNCQTFLCEDPRFHVVKFFVKLEKIFDQSEDMDIQS
jgi:hypothetical protein